MLAVTLVVALVAVAGLVFANKKRLEADARSRDALANELVADGLNKLANAGRARDDVAMQLILAARTSPRIMPSNTRYSARFRPSGTWSRSSTRTRG